MIDIAIAFGLGFFFGGLSGVILMGLMAANRGDGE